MQYNIIAILFVEAIFLICAIGSYISLWQCTTRVNDTKPIEIVLLVFFSLAFSAGWLITTFSMFPSFKITFNENGISKFVSFRLFSLKLWEHFCEITWEDVSELKWQFEWQLTGYHLVGKDQRGQDTFLILSFAMSNRNNAIKYIIDHLPKEKIQKRIYKKFAEKRED